MFQLLLLWGNVGIQRGNIERKPVNMGSPADRYEFVEKVCGVLFVSYDGRCLTNLQKWRSINCDKIEVGEIIP